MQISSILRIDRFYVSTFCTIDRFDACLTIALIGEERIVANGCSSVSVGARTNANFFDSPY